MSLQSQGTGTAAWTEKRASDEHSGPHPLLNAKQPAKVTKTDDDGNVTGWIEALGVDPNYKPPTEKPAKPIACFYIVRKEPEDAGKRELHRAVYLTERSLSNFISRVAAKWNLDCTTVTRAVRVVGRGLEIEIDDDVIRELSEGQDMVLEIAEIDIDVPEARRDREWEMMAVDVPEGGRISTHSAFRTTTGYELRFTF
jgi:hypothetical protein